MSKYRVLEDCFINKDREVGDVFEAREVRRNGNCVTLICEGSSTEQTAYLGEDIELVEEAYEDIVDDTIKETEEDLKASEIWEGNFSNVPEPNYDPKDVAFKQKKLIEDPTLTDLKIAIEVIKAFKKPLDDIYDLFQ